MHTTHPAHIESPKDKRTQRKIQQKPTQTHSDSLRLTPTHSDSLRLTQTHSDCRMETILLAEMSPADRKGDGDQ